MFNYFFSFDRICFTVVMGSTLITSSFISLAMPQAEDFRTAIIQFWIYFFICSDEGLFIAFRELLLIIIIAFWSWHMLSLLRYSFWFMRSLLLVLAVLLVHANTALVQVTEANFHDHFNCPLGDFLNCPNPNKNEWFIMFMAPWCGHCKNAKPHYEGYASIVEQSVVPVLDENNISRPIKEVLKTVVVDCTTDRPICSYFDIRGYPTFIFLTSDKDAFKYKGPRKIENFWNFTLYRQTQFLERGERVKIGRGLMDDILEAVQQYWVQILVFGIIVPSLVGYCLGQLIFGRKHKKSDGSAELKAELNPAQIEQKQNQRKREQASREQELREQEMREREMREQEIRAQQRRHNEMRERENELRMEEMRIQEMRAREMEIRKQEQMKERMMQEERKQKIREQQERERMEAERLREEEAKKYN